MSNNLEDFLVWSDGTIEFRNNLINKIAEYSEIIIFGAGIGGKQTLELLKTLGYENKMKAFTDNSKEKIGTIYLGYPIISPIEISEKFRAALILVSSTAFSDIKQQLLEMPEILENNIYYFQPAGLSLEKNDDLEFIKKNISKYQLVYQKLADEKSQFIFSNLLNYRITKKIKYLDELAGNIDEEEGQYFDRDILSEYTFDEGFVDAGAYIGDTMSSFYKRYPDYQGNYYCLEADPLIYKKLCKDIKERNNPKILAYQCAVWDEEGEVKFDSTSFGNGEGNRISEKGDSVKCCSLDKLFAGKKISFVKMDIEGAERKGLLGAREIIKSDLPILAICIYHRPEDFFDIPMLIDNIAKNEYTFFIRQYRFGQSETVLYAMPKIRKRKKVV